MLNKLDQHVYQTRGILKLLIPMQVILSSLDIVLTDKLSVRTKKETLEYTKKTKEKDAIIVCNRSSAIKVIEMQMLKNLEI